MRVTLPLVLVTLGMGAASTVPAQTLQLVRVQDLNATELAARLESEGFDVLSPAAEATSLELVVSEAELRALLDRGLEPERVSSGRPFREIQGELEVPEGSVPAGYPDLATVYARMAQAATDHPGICQLVDLTVMYGMPPTSEGRHMMAVKISDNAALDEDEPAVLFVSCHHARELVTPVIGLESIDRLTDDYGVVPAVTSAVDAHEIWIAPVWNPDGYEYVFSSDNFWRKNRRPLQGGTGVDQNRNYPQGWSNACSGSTNTSSQTYKGPSPASEPETQTMLALAMDRRFAKVVDFHSSGREALWGYACPTHPLDNFYKAEAVALATAAGYGGQEKRPSADGEHQQWHFARQGASSYLLETANSFQPSYASALAEAAMVWGAVSWTLARDIPVSGHVTDACNGLPIVATVTVVGQGIVQDETNSSGGAFGRYHAYLPSGGHSLRFEAPGYVSRTLPVTVVGSGATTLEVSLDPTSVGGVNYCISAPNSVGPGAIIFGTGTTSVSANNFRLNAIGMPGNQFALFIYGLNATQTPLFEGFLCVGAPLIRLVPVQTDLLGTMEVLLDLANPPVPSGQITPGSTWNFQAFYRDQAFGGTMANLSGGLRVVFCP